MKTTLWAQREVTKLILCMCVHLRVCVCVYPTCTKNVLKCKIDYLLFPFCQVTSCSFQAATGQQPIKTLSCWALTCPRPREPAWNSGPTSRTHVRISVLSERLYLVHLWSGRCSRCCVHALILFWKPHTFLMYAADTKLRVCRLSEGLLHQLLVVDEMGGPWKRFDINIASTEEYQVRLLLYILI